MGVTPCLKAKRSFLRSGASIKEAEGSISELESGVIKRCLNKPDV